MRCPHLLVFPLIFPIVPQVFPMIVSSHWLSLNKTHSFFLILLSFCIASLTNTCKTNYCFFADDSQTELSFRFLSFSTNRKISTITLCLCGCLQVFLKVSLSKKQVLILTIHTFFSSSLWHYPACHWYNSVLFFTWASLHVLPSRVWLGLLDAFLEHL